VAVTAEQLHGAEREEAWQQVTAAAPRFAGYQTKTDRELPVIRLVPRSGGEELHKASPRKRHGPAPRRTLKPRPPEVAGPARAGYPPCVRAGAGTGTLAASPGPPEAGTGTGRAVSSAAETTPAAAKNPMTMTSPFR
jgi:F420H(2)-dependent quinone reductase